MEREEQIRQLKKLFVRIDEGTTVDAGGFRKNPTSVYVDPELAEREWQQFFRRHPQLIGLTGDLPGPGAFMTLNDLGTPILATRDGEGRFRAFVNSCRHRGAILEERERGEARHFVCPFHSWTYASDGRLIGLPKREHFGEIDTACRGLVELPSVEAHGLLFVHPRPDGEIDLDAVLGEALRDEFDHWNYGGLELLGEDAYDMPCNWKLAMDTFGETYHFTSLHKDTLALDFKGNVQCYDTFGHNHRMLLVTHGIDLLRGQPESEWHINQATLPVYWIFPNVQLMPTLTGCFLVRAYPIRGEPGRHRSRIQFYSRPGMSDEDYDQARVRQRGMAEGFAEVIRDEDYAMGASQQRAAESGVVDHLLFGRNEPALHHYHSTYRDKLGLKPLPLLSAEEVAADR